MRCMETIRSNWINFISTRYVCICLFCGYLSFVWRSFFIAINLEFCFGWDHFTFHWIFHIQIATQKNVVCLYCIERIMSKCTFSQWAVTQNIRLNEVLSLCKNKMKNIFRFVVERLLFQVNGKTFAFCSTRDESGGTRRGDERET